VTPVDFEGEQFFIAVRYDISDRKKAEAENFKREKQLLQADKMASLGILTSGVAHEINNPNHLILSNNELLEKVWFDIQKVLETQCQEQGDFDLAGVPYSEMKALIPQMFDRVRGGSERISNIVDGLKNFAREDQIGMDQRVDLNEVISKSLPLVDRLIKKSTDHFSLDLEDKLPVIRGSFQQMEQVFINFVTNACQALTSREQSITVHTFCTHASVGLSVCDEGSGLDENVQKKVMDPFFTTKHDQGGTGLGLFVTYGIVQRHRGELQLTSQDQQGCCARVTFPKCGHQGWGIER
jgi:signal transduction histidine kinase